MIKSIEHVRAQCQFVTFPRHREDLGDAEVDVLHTVAEERVAAEQIRVEIGRTQRAKSGTRERDARRERMIHAAAEYRRI